MLGRARRRVRGRIATRGLALACVVAATACGPAAVDSTSDSGPATTSEPDASAATTPAPVASGVRPHPADVAAALAASFSAEDLDTHARAIVAHERPSGSDGENAAIDYVVNTLEAAGVPVRVDEFEAYLSTPVSATVQVVGDGYAPEAITVAYSGAAEALVAEVVDLGTLADLPILESGTGEMLDVVGATLASEQSELDELPDVAGKIVLVTGQPRNGPTATLEALGAAGVVFVNPEERVNDLIVTSTWGSPSLRNYHRLPQLPVAHVPHSAGERLRAYLDRGPLELQLDVEIDTGWKTLRLATARIEPPGRGRGPYVLFGGHIDAWHHGATDEGASNAAMLSLAISLHQQRASLARGVVVAWWPGHSNGRYAGSTWFADQYATELRQRAVAYLNVDGIGQRGASEFGAATTASLARLAQSVVLDGAGSPLEPGRPGTNSDQSFNGIGLPLLQLYHNRSAEDRGTWWWHTPEDTFDKIDFDILKVDADLYAAALAALAVPSVLPLDLVAQAEAAGEALARRAEEADSRLDLAAARAAHARMSRTFAALHAQLTRDTVGVVPGLDVEVVRILRPLHRVLYVAGTPHHPDPGRGPGALPGLWPARVLAEEEPGSDRYGFAHTTLVREANRIVEAFDETTARSEALVRRLQEIDGDD